MNIAIITRPDYRSPRILGESLKLQIEKAGGKAELFYSINVLTRLNSYAESRSKINFHYWFRKKLINYRKDRQVLAKLKEFDAVVISECSPNGFWKQLYHIEKLKKILKKPVLFYEVYYLGNAPTQIETLIKSGEASIERYDLHLAVSEVTEIKSKPESTWSCIGLDLTATGLQPTAKKEFVALVDFLQPGYEKYHEEQIRVLNELGIKTIVLNGRYTTEEIRSLYRQASIFLMQFPEAFGLPIAECLACGVQIFTPDTGWPMSWRLNENPQVHGAGTLAEVFTSYSSKEDLKLKLTATAKEYDIDKTPFQIFESFIASYPHFYFGKSDEVKKLFERIGEKQLN